MRESHRECCAGRGSAGERGRTPGASGVDRAYGTGRVSGQRREIAEAAREMPGAFTVDDLLRAVRARGSSVGVATVYRAVAAMEASGFLEVVGTRDGVGLYACCAHPTHHHHLVCTGCGTTVACACPVEDSVRSAADAAGFEITAHEMTVYGRCAVCRRDEER